MRVPIFLGKGIITNDKLFAVVQTLEYGVRCVEGPLQRPEHVWHMSVSYLVIPIFALVNTGTTLELDSLGETLTHPVMLGVSLGLMLIKLVGITGASCLLFSIDYIFWRLA